MLMERGKMVLVGLLLSEEMGDCFILLYLFRGESFFGEVVVRVDCGEVASLDRFVAEAGWLGGEC